MRTKTNIKLKRGRINMPLALNSVFYVTSDSKGQKDLATLKRCLNTANYSIRIKGRNPDRLAIAARNNESKFTVWQTVRKADASYFAVYLDPQRRKLESERKWKQQTYAYQEQLRYENTTLRTDVFELRSQLREMTAQRDSLDAELQNVQSGEVLELREQLAKLQEALQTLVIHAAGGRQ